MDTNENKYLTLLSKVLSREASATEKEQLDQWVKEDSSNQAFVEDITKTWDLTGQYAENIPVNTDAAWAKFETKFAKQSIVKPRFTMLKLVKSWQAAAAVLLVSCSGLWLYSNYNNNTELLSQFKTNEGEQKELTLPDGSVVTLNENSSLAYKSSFENRIVELKGEAFFDVVKQNGNTFEILTTTTKTTVLGTSFNVRAYAQEPTEVAVFTGKVAVEALSNKNNNVLLLPNERAICDASNNIQKIADSDSNKIAWKTKKLIFNNTELKELKTILEHYFEVEIKIDNEKILRCHFTGQYDKPQLQEIVDAVAFSNDLEIKKVNEQYILSGQGCE